MQKKIQFCEREQSFSNHIKTELFKHIWKPNGFCQQKPASLASAGSSPEQEKSHDDMVFDAILGAENKLEKALGF